MAMAPRYCSKKTCLSPSRTRPPRQHGPRVGKGLGRRPVFSEHTAIVMTDPDRLAPTARVLSAHGLTLARALRDLLGGLSRDAAFRGVRLARVRSRGRRPSRPPGALRAGGGPPAASETWADFMPDRSGPSCGRPTEGRLQGSGSNHRIPSRSRRFHSQRIRGPSGGDSSHPRRRLSRTERRGLQSQSGCGPLRRVCRERGRVSPAYGRDPIRERRLHGCRVHAVRCSGGTGRDSGMAAQPLLCARGWVSWRPALYQRCR